MVASPRSQRNWIPWTLGTSADLQLSTCVSLQKTGLLLALSVMAGDWHGSRVALTTHTTCQLPDDWTTFRSVRSDG